MATRNAAAIQGVTRPRPPISPISRVCVRSYSIPIAKNRSPVDRPWFTIWITAPLMPSAVKVKMPRITNPMWLTDEYATRRFTSVCIMATIAPYTMPTTARTLIASAKYRDASGNRSRLNRRIP